MDRSKITFEQAEGTDALPSQLALGELSKEARALIWNELYVSLREDHREKTVYEVARVTGSWNQILRHFHVQRLHQPSDEFDTAWDFQIEFVKSTIFETQYDKALGFLQWTLRHRDCPGNLFEKIQNALASAKVAYILVDDPPTLVPAATPEEGQALVTALSESEKHGLIGAEEHLRGAIRELNEGNFAGSVRESINAVESTARRLNEKASSTLGPALKALKKKGAIHPALEGAFLKLYGYTSDEQGVRHSISDDADAVGPHEAVFMLGACASFVTYLINQGRDAGLLD